MSSQNSLKYETTNSSAVEFSDGPIELYAEGQCPKLRRASGRSMALEDYSVKNIYGDLDSAEIEEQRAAARNTIIDEIAQRTQEVDDEERYVGLGRAPSNRSTYEEAYLDKLPIENSGSEFSPVDPELITWNGPCDPEDPKNWNPRTKAMLIGFVSLYALVAPMSLLMPLPAMEKISTEFHITSDVTRAMVVSIQILAWALGPLLIAPLSEHDRIGRKLVLDGLAWMSLFFNLGCAFSKNTAQMMVCRFIGGLFGCVPLNVGAGVISDLYEAESRLLALAGYSLAPLLGPVIAPVVSGFIVQNMQWRWTFYVLCMFNGFVAVFATIFFKETYTPKLLLMRARRLRHETGNNALHTIYEITDSDSFVQKSWITMSRPVVLLFSHPMIVGLGSMMAFTYGFMYLMIVAFPTIFGKQYGFSTLITGLMYLPMGVGFTLGVIFWTYFMGLVYKKLTIRNGGVQKPEFRIPCLLGASLCVPVGLVWFGWSAEKHLHWIMPGIGLAIFAFGLVCVFQSLQSYLIDMNPRYAALLVAAAALFRSLFGFLFPLFANKMYASMGYGWGNTMCAFVGLLLGIPFPIVCFIYGERIRAWADARLERGQKERDEKRLEKLRKKAGEKQG